MRSSAFIIGSRVVVVVVVVVEKKPTVSSSRPETDEPMER
jgi:hypothetical protein